MDLKDGVRVSLIAGAAALVAGGTLALNPSAADDLKLSRLDEPAVIADTDDDDDDDDSDPTGEDGPTNSNDATNSAKTAVSRDKDRSVGGLTRDMTLDGPGGLKRDWSDNHTNDVSVNDTRASVNTNDGTRSNYTPVSRDRDRSRGDVTKDWTMDGGDQTRDLTRNLTNDGTRNDTR